MALGAARMRELVDVILKTGRPVLCTAGVSPARAAGGSAHQCVAPLIGSSSAHQHQQSQIEGPSVALRLLFVLTVTTLAWAVSRRLQRMTSPQLARRKP
ncbi:MAG: hypothetical protein NTW87_02000 [Planctomycetota bacterium]|nr:hypothetical protein [Planctomycetota bacterium]